MLKKTITFFFGLTTVRTVIISALISLLTRLTGLLKESFIAKYLGVSATTDFYVISLIIVTFFTGPLIGSINPALTRKICEGLDSGVSEIVAMLVTKTMVLSIFVMTLMTILLVLTTEIFFSSAISAKLHH